MSAGSHKTPIALEGFFPYHMAVAADGLSRGLADVYGSEFGLSREEWRLLFLLAGVSDVDSRELARRTTLDKVQVSRASQRLVEKGLIQREVSETDRRLRIYACTEKGRSLFARTFPKVEAKSTKILQAMPPAERAALERGVAALIRALHQVEGSAEETTG
ncbi:MAG: MarR family winged helix-turn-helix transcriptional regulator [Pelagimonas sp.]|jgi:DNA-binding MarR family transcriptional regulator|nr:MarR family winged helix-turn-helix transcriptional regulator [Pelagimonas sp.]